MTLSTGNTTSLWIHDSWKGALSQFPVLPCHLLIWINLLRKKTFFSSYSLIFRHTPSVTHSLPPILLLPSDYAAWFLSTTKVPGLKLFYFKNIINFFFHLCFLEVNLYHKELSEHNGSTFTIIPIFSKSAKLHPRFCSHHFTFLHFVVLQPPQPKVPPVILANITESE